MVDEKKVPRIRNMRLKREVLNSVMKTRTRLDELIVIQAMLSTVRGMKGRPLTETLHEIVKIHPWLAVYFRIVFDPRRKHGLKSKHLKKVAPANPKTEGRCTTVYGLLSFLNQLNLKKVEPIAAVHEWRAILMELPEDFRSTANRVLDKDFGPVLTKELVNEAMKSNKIKPRVK